MAYLYQQGKWRRLLLLLPLSLLVLPLAARAEELDLGYREPVATLTESYAFDFSVDRRANAGGGSILLQSPLLATAPLNLQLRSEVGYGTLLLDRVLPRANHSGDVDVGLVTAGGVLACHAWPTAAVFPALRLDAILAFIRSDELTSRKTSVGGRAGLSFEVPLTFLRDDVDDDDDDSASLVLGAGLVFGLPRAEKVAGRPDVLNGWTTSFGLRFYL